MYGGICWRVVLGIALFIGFTPIPAARPEVRVPDVLLTAGEEDIVIDIVRHGQMQSPYDMLLTPSPAYPGAPLSDLGQQQAEEIGQQLYNQLGPVAGVFDGQGLREMGTAVPFAHLEDMTAQVLPGLNEIDSGIFALDPINSVGGRLAFLIAAGWALGSPLGLAWLPVPGGIQDVNGLSFDERFTGAIDTMYTDPIANPVVSDNGDITAVGFNSEASIFVWTMMNVKNPDLSFFIPRIIESHLIPNGFSDYFLPNTGVVQIEGSPTDGWTLVSWDGQPVPQNPGLPTELFVDTRNLVLPIDLALWNIWEAVLGGNPATIGDALVDGAQTAFTATVDFPVAVADDVVAALQNLLTGIGAQAAADAGALAADLLTSLL